jgi:acyl carrier protein
MSREDDLLALIADVVKTGRDEVKPDEKLVDSLEIDSTEMVELLTVIEKKFGVSIEEGSMTNQNTPREILAVIEGLLK